MSLRQRKAKDPILPLHNSCNDDCDGSQTNANDKRIHGASSTNANINNNNTNINSSLQQVMGTSQSALPFKAVSRKHSKGEPSLVYTVYVPLLTFFSIAFGFAYLTVSGGGVAHFHRSRDHHHTSVRQHSSQLRRKNYHQHTAGKLNQGHLQHQEHDGVMNHMMVDKLKPKASHPNQEHNIILTTTKNKPLLSSTKTFRLVQCPDGADGYLNDDYCDCADGSDESLTSACSHITAQKATFHCLDGTGRVIYASRVRDGVRDCPDGSDEVV